MAAKKRMSVWQTVAVSCKACLSCKPHIYTTGRFCTNKAVMTGNRSSKDEAAVDAKYTDTEAHAHHSGPTHTTGIGSEEYKDAGTKFKDTDTHMRYSGTPHTTGNRSDECKDAGIKYHDPETHLPHSGAPHTTGIGSEECKDAGTKFKDTDTHVRYSGAPHTTGNRSDECNDAGIKYHDPETHVPHPGVPHTTGNISSEDEAVETKYTDIEAHTRHSGPTHTTGKGLEEYKDAGTKLQDTDTHVRYSGETHTTSNRSEECKDAGIKYNDPDTHVPHSGAPHTTGNKSSNDEAVDTKYTDTEAHTRHSGPTHTTGNGSEEYKDADTKFMDTDTHVRYSGAPHTTGNRSDECKGAGIKYHDPETHVPHSGAPHTTANISSEDEAVDTKYTDTEAHARHSGPSHTTGIGSEEYKDASTKFKDADTHVRYSGETHTTGNRSDECKDAGIKYPDPETHVPHSGAPHTTGNRSSEHESVETKYTDTEAHARHSGPSHTTGNGSQEYKDASTQLKDTDTHVHYSGAPQTTGNRSDECKDAGIRYLDLETHVPHAGAPHTTGNQFNEYEAADTKYPDTEAHARLSGALLTTGYRSDKYKNEGTKFQDTDTHVRFSDASHTTGNRSEEYKDDGTKIQDTDTNVRFSGAPHTTGNRSDECKDAGIKLYDPETHVPHSGAPHTTGNRPSEHEAVDTKYTDTEAHARHSGPTHTTGYRSSDHVDADIKYTDTETHARHSGPTHTTGNRSNECKDAGIKCYDPETHVHRSGTPHPTGNRSEEYKHGTKFQDTDTHVHYSGTPHTVRPKAQLRIGNNDIPYIIWPYTCKGGYQVSCVPKEFVLYVTDKVTTARIKLFDLDIKMERAKSGFIFKKKVYIQRDCPSRYKYGYRVEMPGYMYGTRTTKYKSTFELDRGETLRDILEGKPADGILAHMNDIESCELDLRETYTQMKGLNYTKLTEIDQKSLHSQMSREVQSCLHEKRRIRPVVLFFIIINANEIDLNLSNEEASQFLQVFEDPHLLQLQSLFSPLVLKLISKVCRQSFDNDTKGIVQMFYSYSWLGEHLFDSKCDIRNIPVKYQNYVVSLFMKIYQSGSFESDTSKKLIKTIINDLSFEILISTYADLIERKSLEESYNTFKSLIQEETLKRTNKKLHVCCGLGVGKMAHFFRTWENVRDIGDGRVPFQIMFEKCLFELIALSSLQNTEKIVQIAQEQILFATQESKSELLIAIASSPNCVAAGLFFQLVCVPSFVEIYKGLDTTIFKQWYYNSLDKGKSNKLISMTGIAERLLLIVTLTSASDNNEIITIIKSILSDELRNMSLDKVLKGAVEFATASNENNLLISCFIDCLSEELQTVTTDVEKLFRPFLSGEELQLKTKIVADISYLIIGKYVKTHDRLSPTDQFFNTLDQRRLWGLVFAATGPYKHIVEKHPLYRTTANCIKITAERLSTLEIDFKLMNRITKRKEAVTNVLSYFGKREEIEDLLVLNEKMFDDAEKSMTSVISVMSLVKKQSIKLPDGFGEFIKEIEKKKESFYEGKINGKNYQLLWTGMMKVPEYCRDLETVIQSVVYWNIVRDESGNVGSESNTVSESGSEECESSAHKEEKLDIGHISVDSEISSVGNDQTGLEDFDTAWKNSLEYLKNMRYDCFEKYTVTMEKMLKSNDTCMSEILHMFDCKAVFNPALTSGPDINMEKRIVEKVLPNLHVALAWEALHHIYNIGKVKTKVENMRSFLSVIRIDLNSDPEFESALDSFEQLIRDNVNDVTFVKVKYALDTIYSITNKLSDETFDIMGAIGKCSTLIDFLKETVDEDIRNLIDAVEDISEQQVRESTVSGLIEMKQLLHPVLKQESCLSCQKLLNSFNAQIKEVKKVEDFPAKIHDCMDNLHNLKSLYNNVANRGEQTKQIVYNIIELGVFQFALDKKVGSVSVKASYYQNDNRVVKEMSELSDLRSRSLLLMNNESYTSGSSNLTREQVEMFVGYVDQCVEVADLCTLLHTYGHFMYIDINIKELLPSALAEKCKRLEKELKSWQMKLSNERNNRYLMNYINGYGLQVMYQYLNLYEEMSGQDKEKVEDTAKAILVFIHPKMKADELRKQYITEKKMCKPWTNKDWLYCLGKALHLVYQKFSTFTQNFNLQEKEKMESLKMTDVVQEGKLFVAQLDEHSAYTVRTVLALFANTTNRMPEPHQVLFCTQETSFDEIELLIERCIGAKHFYKDTPLYCIANVELLTSEFYIDLLEMLSKLQEEHSHFLLALVCRGTNSHPVIDELNNLKTTIAPATDSFVRSVFKAHFGHILTLTSDLAGLGKSYKVIKAAHSKGKQVSILHVSGCARKGHLIERLRTLKIRSFHVLHIDIGTVDDPKALDTFLFELLILRYASVGRTCVALETNCVYLEIANTINDTLRNSLQTAMLFSREHKKWHNFDDFIVSKEIHSGIQIVCKYFDYLEKGYLDQREVHLNESKPMSTKKCRKLLNKYLNTKDDMSFPVVTASLDILADQFKKMSCSPFFRISRLRDMTGNKSEQSVKSSLVKEMINSTREFASRSVSSCRATQLSTILPDTEHLSGESSKEGDIATSVSQRIKGMIRWEDSNHLMFVFHCQNIQTLSPLFRDRNKVPNNIKDLFQSQMNKELQDFKTFSQDELQDLLQKLSRNNPLPLPSKKLREMASEYALTPDNLLKMVLIMLRIKANVPVVIMGETGCGKTSLVRYLASICEVEFDILNIHAGVSEEEIIDKVQTNCLSANKSLHTEQWLFLDEINTSESIGIMTEIICHHKCLGKSLPPNLIVMGACNPYKLRSSKDIATAGLTMKSRNDELSRLVYRVLPLPEMMVDYVWDFGSLHENDEGLYIQRMVEGVFEDAKLQILFSDMLSASQSFVRQREGSAYAVSLRDVYRCKVLTKWFIDILAKKETLRPYSFDCSTNIRAIILALAHCYHSRFHHKDFRADYRKVLRAKLKDHGISGFEINQDKVADVINEEQKDLISRMELPEGTACNTALMENVFVIIVCIYNRLPVFVVGKPGCSKSLAMQVIRSNLRGKDSKDTFFKGLPQLYCVSFQGSESSTSDGIIKVFAKAKNYQTSNNVDDVLSVVILDEIGLAEVSRFNPLKVLHNLLEPKGEMRPNVAVVGLSNWSLDASKMNRAIHLSRTDMDEDELYKTASAISESFTTMCKTKSLSPKASFIHAVESNEDTDGLDEVISLDDTLTGISKSYHKYSERLRFKNFHGLRDYYALVKYVAVTYSPNKCKSVQECHKTKPKPSTVVNCGLERNFGGLPCESTTLYEIFNSHFHFDSNDRRNVLDLITENVDDPIARHLMLITSGDSAIGILEQQLSFAGQTRIEIIFGSQFEDDATDEYNYRILSRIILCMEEGIKLILKDLDNIYGSLYDMLNQNYTIIGNKKNCRVALGAYSNPICQVAGSFRCVVLVDESKLESCDPPFLNRFEKQYLRFSDILNAEETSLVQDLQTWIKGLRDIHDRTYDFTDVLPIYSEDLLPSLVLKTEREFEGADENYNSSLTSSCKGKLMCLLKPEAVIRLKRAVSNNTCIDADEIKNAFFDLPLHCGLEHFISSQLSNACSKPEEEGILTIVFTRSNMHINLHRCISNKNVQTEKLGAFKSEKQVSAKIQQFWSENTKANILLVQCSAVDDEKHIMLTKSIIERHRTSYNSENRIKKHVYLIIHMSKNKDFSKVVSQINFMSNWGLVMLDSLECPQMTLPQLCDMDILEAIKNKRPLDKCLTRLLFWSFTRIKYCQLGRDVGSIQAILTKMKTSSKFLQFLDEEIWRIVSEMKINERDWQIKVACDVQALRSSPNFVDALEQHIIKVIKIPLAKLIFCMEDNGVLDSYFIEDGVSEERKQFLVKLLHDEQTFSLAKIPDETGPECYSCETADCVLRMPFSKIIFSRIESQKEEFMEEVSVLKGKFDVDQNEVLPPNVYADLLVKQENLAVLNTPDWMQYFYKTCEKDYIHDFSSMMSVNICSGMHREKRALYMEWIVSQKSDLSQKSILGLSVRLHTSFWMNISLFRSEMQLLAICVKVRLDKHVLEKLLQYSGLLSQRQPFIEDKRTIYERVDTDTELHPPKHELENDVVAADESETYADNVPQIQDMSAEDYLVQDICKEMIPTEAIINRYEGISSWQRTVDAILALAAKVSTESKMLFSLRVCNEIASNIIIPLKIDTARIYPLGTLFLDENIELDSYEVFETVVDIISAGLRTETSSYRVFSSYLVRCICTNTETSVLRYLFEYTLDNTIPGEMIHHFRAPLYLAADLERDTVDEKKLLQYFLLEDVSGSELGKEEESRDESEDITSYPEEGNQALLHTFDEFLRNLAEKKRHDDPFVLVIVDLLVDIFEKTVRYKVFDNYSSDRFRTIFDCHKILLDEEFGLRFVSALSYIKSFLSLLEEKSMWDYDKNREYWKAVNVILSDVKPNHISFSLLSHFIKSISKGLTIPQLKVHIKTKKENHDFFGKLEWTSGYSHFSFDGNPFCLLLGESQHRQLDLCNPSQGITKAKEKLVSFLSSRAYDAQWLQGVLCFVLNEFHLSETFETESKDTVHDVLLHFLNEVKDQKCSWHAILTFLCGAENFKHHGFDLLGNSKYLNYSAQFVLLHFFILLWSHNSCDEKNKTSVFMRCLESPRTLKNCPLPGFLDTTSDSCTKISSNAGLATCNCGSRIVFHFGGAETSAEMECVFCPEALVCEKSAPVQTGKSAGERSLIWEFEDIPKDQIEIRGLHPFTFHFLQFVVKGCILGSLALGLATIEDAKDIAGDEFCLSYLLDNITKHWTQLQKQLCLDDCSLGTLLRVIFVENREHFVKHHSHPFTEELRSELEKGLEKQLQKLLHERSKSVKSTICQHHKLHRVKDSSFENILKENNNVVHIPERETTLPLLFRINSKPTKENFISELGWRKAEFPFLCLILQFEKQLGLPQHIHNIIQWHVTAVASVNYMLKKHECLEMTVQDFIFINQKKKDMVKKRFILFSESWDGLYSYFKSTEIGSAMNRIHTATKMKDCLIYNQETIIYKVLKMLVNIQNQFLDETLLIANVSEALHFLSVKENVFVFPCVQITETRKEDLVHLQYMSDIWDNMLREESVSRLEYGCGAETTYDFHSIEKRLAMKVLTGVSYIDFRHSIPNIIFADELYINYAGLLLELKKHVKQKQLTPEIIESIQAKRNDDPRMVKELLSHLGILMTLLKKTGGDPDAPLVDYVSKWGNILNHEFPRALLPNPETSVKLCHIIGLNELLEEIYSETVLDALEKEYTEKLDDVAIKHISELLRDLQTADIFLKALKRFMYRGIFSQTADADRPIIGYLNDHSFWPDGCKQKNIIKIGEKEELIQHLLPDYLMVRHVQSMIKQIENEIEKKEKETLHMSEMATDFKKAKDRKRFQHKATAKRAKAKQFREY